MGYRENEDFLYYIPTEKLLKLSSVELLASNVFKNVVFVDSAGISRKVKSVWKTGWSNVFGGYSLMLKGRGVKIEFEFETPYR